MIDLDRLTYSRIPVATRSVSKAHKFGHWVNTPATNGGILRRENKWRVLPDHQLSGQIHSVVAPLL
jgi:hypothetical protein